MQGFRSGGEGGGGGTDFPRDVGPPDENSGGLTPVNKYYRAI